MFGCFPNFKNAANDAGGQVRPRAAAQMRRLNVSAGQGVKEHSNQLYGRFIDFISVTVEIVNEVVIGKEHPDEGRVLYIFGAIK